MQNLQIEGADYMCFQWKRVLISFDVYLAVELVGHWVGIFLAFGETDKMFSKAFVLIYTLSVVEASSSGSLNSVFLICFFSKYGHSSENVVIFYMVLILLSLKFYDIGYFSFLYYLLRNPLL